MRTIWPDFVRRCSGVVIGGRHIPAGIPRPPYIDGAELAKPPTAECQSPEQISAIRSACRIVRGILHDLATHIQPGMTTEDVDSWVFDRCMAAGVYPSPLGYQGFPRSVCTSVNGVACHGIPSQDVVLGERDIVSVDVTVYNGVAHGDSCEAFLVGEANNSSGGSARRLIDISRECLHSGIAVCGPGVPFGAIGEAVESRATRDGFNVVRNILGHGIGAYFHGPPDICHHRETARSGVVDVMRPGMVFTVEPCITEGSGEVGILDDGWTVVTLDGGRCAQFEHTVLVTEHGHEVLTA